MTTIIEITRPGPYGEIPITIEVEGRYKPEAMDTDYSPGRPAKFEDIRAIVLENTYMDEDETVLRYKAGEIIPLHLGELRQANEALLDARENATFVSCEG